MVDEQEEKFEGSEESEYHFSDEEVGYEADPESAKPVMAEPTKNWISDLTRSKRMLISLGVFLALVFVVYKMVSPSSTAPSTDITPAASNATMAQTAPAVKAEPAQAPQPSMMPPQPTAAPAAAMPAPSTAPAPAAADQSAAMQGVQQASMTPPPAAPETAPASAAAMPNVIPVPTGQPAAAPPAEAANTPLSNSIDNRTAQMAATNEQLMAQLQADYAQRLADYQAQNKTLQDQVQTLNARVASMETEMGQLIQTLTKQFQNGSSEGAQDAGAAPSSTDAGAAAAAPVTPDIKLPYTVQAIIPGRAWLRSDSGDTLTVAEGDTIKDVGQVTKIDPYDGVVEIKVGNKAVSLSYGNGG